MTEPEGDESPRDVLRRLVLFMQTKWDQIEGLLETQMPSIEYLCEHGPEATRQKIGDDKFNSLVMFMAMTLKLRASLDDQKEMKRMCDQLGGFDGEPLEE